MKKTVVKGMLAAAVLAAIVGCSNPTGGNNQWGGDPTPTPTPTPTPAAVTGTWENTDTDGNSYRLELAAGNTYTLTVTLRTTGQVKRSTGAVQGSGSSFTLTPANASGTFSVTVNPGKVITTLTMTWAVTYDNGDAAAAPVQLSADKTALKTAIADANAARAGVFTAASAEEVPAGASWVTPAALAAFTTAAAAAEGLEANPAAGEDAVNHPAAGAVKQLRDAITAFNGAKGTGTKAGAPAVNRTALIAAIAAARAAKTGVVTADTGGALANGAKWVLPAEMTAFNDAITAAEAAAADASKDQGAVDGAKTTLEGKTTVFTGTTIKTVALADKAALGAALITAKAAKAGVKVAGVDTLSPGDWYVSAAVMNTFNTAVTDAEGVDEDPAALQGDVNGKVTALEGAITTFNVAKTYITVPTYTVAFDSAGGSVIPNQVVEEGGTVTQPEDPARTDHYFGGWYKDNPSALWGFGVTPVTGNITLHAKWLDETAANTADFGAGSTIKTPITVTDGTTWNSAFTTINGTPGNYIVTVSGTITGLTPETISGANSVVSLRGTGSLTLGSSNGSLITVGSSAALILRGPALQGKDNNNAAVVTVDGSGAEFIMHSGAIRGNENTNNGGSGGVAANDGAKFTMNGGTISGNTGVNGGGVRAESDDGASGTFEMNGGTISGNTGSESGGGVDIHKNGIFIMNGGTISGNSAGFGGGVCTGRDTSSFTMNGGTISGNTATGYFGGGVAVGDGTFTMTGGTISGNSATGSSYGYGGGVGMIKATGIVFTKTGGTVYGNNAGVNSNHAQADGKGRAVCVVSVTGPEAAPVITVLSYRDATAGPEVNIDTSTDAGLQSP